MINPLPFYYDQPVTLYMWYGNFHFPALVFCQPVNITSMKKIFWKDMTFYAIIVAIMVGFIDNDFENDFEEVAKTDNDLKNDFKVDSHFKEKLSESHFQSYHEFAEHVCIPCHYGENGTNLVKPIEMMTENDLKNYLDAMLNYRKMPPDEVFRKILLGKLIFLKKRL
jgi:Na+/H+ antiporter NhaB